MKPGCCLLKTNAIILHRSIGYKQIHTQEKQANSPEKITPVCLKREVTPLSYRGFGVGKTH